MPPSVKPDIRVTIISDSQAESCNASCGLDWSSAGVIKEAKQQVKARFGDRVQIKHINLAKSAGKATEHDRPLPGLLINGALRISGQLDIRMLLNAIDTEIEIGSNRKPGTRQQ